MIEAVIFDYGRTIYDPETDQLFPGTIDVFENLKSRQIRLGLVSIAEKGIEERQLDLIRLAIADYFQAVRIFGRREQKDFTEVLQILNVEASNSVIIGDNLRREITQGNALGAQTVWTKQKLMGPFKPRSLQDTPKFMIYNILELLPLIDSLNQTNEI